MKNTLLPLLSLLFCNCSNSLKLVSPTFIIKKDIIESIRYDGYYVEENFVFEDDISQNSINGITFIKGNRLFEPQYILAKQNETSLLDYRNEILKSIKESKNLFTVEGNVLKCYLEIKIKKNHFYHSGFENFYVNFEGEILNKETIINWHIVEPLPKLSNSEMKMNQDLFIPKKLYFIKSNAVGFLDSN